VITTPPKSKPRSNNPAAARGQNAGSGQASADGTAGQNGGSEPTALAPQVNTLNAARENILPKIGTNTYELNRQAIEALPQGDNASLDKVLLQTPGVYQDSAASGSLHIRNEHANLQYRINGIQLPEGVAGFGQVLDTSLIGNMAVVTGALPAQYGLRTAGLVDIQTRSGALEPSGQIGVYGGSNGTFSSNIQYGGVSGNTEYFFTGRFLESDLGIENPTSSSNAIHDHTQQEKFFSYVSTVQPNNSRWTLITGGSIGHYQIPSNPGQQTIDQQGLISTLPSPLNGITFDSAKTNEQQLEQNYFGVLAFQQTVGNVDYQISSFTRYSSVHFTPDLFNDLAFNGIASDVSRHSFLSGVQADGAWRVNASNTLRAGVVVSGEQTYVTNTSTTITSDTNELTNITDRNSKTGWLAGLYLQDEWKITNNLTLNTGLRFDQMWQYVDANQLRPRVSLVYKPLEGTVLHAGYARYFTPPSQAVGAPANSGLFDKTIAASEVTPNTVPGLVISPSLPERSHYFDAGVTQKLAPGLEVGVDAYYKIARDLIDDGQFGAAYVLTAFNYDKGENEGVELKVRYTKEGLMVYGNLAWARQVASNFVSNQYLQGLDDYKFALTNFVATDHSQTVSASAGASYRFWEGTRASVDMIYGSGLRSGDHNSDHLPGYTQFNLGLSHEFTLSDWKPFTLRFDVVNLFDHVYEIRDGSGIGVFAPQFGPRRGYFVGFSQKF
jgi:outer membrane receptor protein involved in Fe transport